MLFSITLAFLITLSVLSIFRQPAEMETNMLCKNNNKQRVKGEEMG